MTQPEEIADGHFDAWHVVAFPIKAQHHVAKKRRMIREARRGHPDVIDAAGAVAFKQHVLLARRELDEAIEISAARIKARCAPRLHTWTNLRQIRQQLPSAWRNKKSNA